MDGSKSDGQPPFVVVEGLDGSGTTTQAELLVERLDREGRAALLTREPSDGPVGALIRQMLSMRVVAPANQEGEFTAVSRDVLALLFAADRLDHIDSEIEPALQSGRIAVSDRYYHSSFAYQGDDGDDGQVDTDWVRTLNERAKMPDLTVYLDASPETCLDRMRNRGIRDIYETREELESLARRYDDVIDELAQEGQRIVRIDAERSREAVHEAIYSAVGDLLGN